MTLGQGIKTFNLDSDVSMVHYPVFVNGNIIAFLVVEELLEGYNIYLTHEFVNALNEVKSLTSEENPLILIKYEDVLCGMIGEQFFAEEKINTEDIHLEEISGEVVLNVLSELSLTEVLEVN